MSSAEAKNLQRIVESIKAHDAKCNSKAKAVMLSPYEHERLGWDEVKVDGRSVPIKPDRSLGTGRLRIVCDGYHGPKDETEEEETVEAPSPAERELVPAGVPEEGLPEWPGNDPIAEDMMAWHQWVIDRCGKGY